MKTLSLGPETLVVLGRRMFSDLLSLVTIDLTGGIVEEMPFPEPLQRHLFRNAIQLQNHIYVVLFDPIADSHFLHRWSLADSGAPSYESTFGVPLANETASFHMDYRCLMAKTATALWIGSNNLVVEIQNSDSPPRFHTFPLRHKLVELIAGGADAVALFRTDRLSIADTGGVPFACYDLIRSAHLDWVTKLSLPYHGRVANGMLSFEWVSEPADLQKALLHDLRDSESSGTLFIGSSNDQGRVAWAQVDYLNGFLDLLVFNSLADEQFSTPELLDQIRLRLDLEIMLLDALLAPEGVGLVSRRYSIDRQTPILMAGHSGLVLKLLNRYRSLLPDAVPLSNYSRFANAALTLTDHLENLEFTNWETPWASPGFAFLRPPFGAPVRFDGVPIPYNLQNAWAEGVLGTPDLPEDVKMNAHRVISFFSESELRNKAPGEHAWPYWYGPARAGWDESASVSLNTRSYAGHNGSAAISYKTMDASAVLALANAAPSQVATATIDLFASALSAGDLNFWLLEKFGSSLGVVEIPTPILLRDARVDGAYTLANTVWSHMLLSSSPKLGADSDNDGAEDSAEFFARTDPANPASNLKLAFAPSNGSTLAWEGQPGVVYELQRKESLNQDWHPAEWIQVPGQQKITWPADTESGATFFRIKVAGQLISQ